MSIVSDKVGIRRLLRHFLTPDHIFFLLILPSVFVSKWLAVVVWCLAFFWDIAEEKIPLMKRIEKWFKG